MGLEEQWDHEKGLSVCWSTRAQRPHIVSLASVGWGYCPPFSHLLFAVPHGHAPERRKKVAFHWWTCTGTRWGGEPVSWLQLPFMISSHSPATCMNATKWPITPTSSTKHQSECTMGWQVYCCAVTVVKLQGCPWMAKKFHWRQVKYWF